jgi:DNA-binding transcriptional LysR family regulator
MTQPAVSIQLKNLQDQFEIPLTEVIGRKLHVTDFGFELAAIAEDILNNVSTIQHKALSFKGLLAGKLSIASVSTGKYIMPYFLSDFLKKHPHIDLRLDVSQREKVIKSLEENSVDFALVSVAPENLEVNQEILMPNKLFLVAPGEIELPEQSLPDSAQLGNIPIIFREKGSGTRLVLEQYLDKFHVNPMVKLELTSTEAVKQAVIAGLGVSVLSVFSIRYELMEKALKIIPYKGFPLLSEWRLIWLKEKKLSPVAQAYLAFIRREKSAIFQQKFSWVNGF